MRQRSHWFSPPGEYHVKHVFSCKEHRGNTIPGCQACKSLETHDIPVTDTMRHIITEYILPYGVHEDHKEFLLYPGGGKVTIGDWPEIDLLPGVSVKLQRQVFCIPPGKYPRRILIFCVSIPQIT